MVPHLPRRRMNMFPHPQTCPPPNSQWVILNRKKVQKYLKFQALQDAALILRFLRPNVQFTSEFMLMFMKYYAVMI